MYIVPSTETHFFSGDGGGGRLLQILNLRRGANSKRGAYLKLGANSSIYGRLTFLSYFLYKKYLLVGAWGMLWAGGSVVQWISG